MNGKSSQQIPSKEALLPKENILQCPFNHTACIKERCAFWVNLSGTQSSPVAGGEKRVSEFLCAFHALLRIGVLLLNKPVAPPIPDISLPRRGG